MATVTLKMHFILHKDPFIPKRFSLVGYPLGNYVFTFLFFFNFQMCCVTEMEMTLLCEGKPGYTHGCCWRLPAAVAWSQPDGQIHSESSLTPVLPAGKDKSDFEMNSTIDTWDRTHEIKCFVVTKSIRVGFQKWPKTLTLGSKHHSQHFGIVMTSTCSIIFKKKKKTLWGFGFI